MVDTVPCDCCADGEATDELATDTDLNDTPATDTDPNDAPASDAPVSVADAMATSIPEDVGAAMERAYELDAPPETVEEWLDGVLDAHRAAGGTPGPADMCTVDDARHEIELNGDRSVPGADGGDSTTYVCVLDPLAVPFIAGHPGTVRSESPVSDKEIRFRVGPGEVSVEPESTVVSLGVEIPREDVESDPDASLSVEDTYEMLCPYGHAFRDEVAYERWAAERDEVATMSFDAETAVGVAVGIARRLSAAG